MFRADNTGVPSLELVRLLNRMIKERKFNVHPEVLSCLLHLRLKTELGVRASETKADKDDANKSQAKGRRGKGKGKGEQVHLSKKAKKVLKERKEIEKEMREAEAEVDKEERAVTVRLRVAPCVPPSSLPAAANRDAQVALRAVLPDLEKSPSDAAAPRGFAGNLQVLSPGQHRFLQGSVESAQGAHGSGVRG